MHSKSAALRLYVESALAGRMASPFCPPSSEPSRTVPAGIPVLDAVTGGLPRGGLTEIRSEEHTSELQSRRDLVCRLLLEKKKRSTIGACSFDPHVTAG